MKRIALKIARPSRPHLVGGAWGLALALATGAPSPAFAATLYWDTATTAGLQAGAGTWDAGSTARWSTSTAGSNPLELWTNGEDAAFQTGGANAVAVSGTVLVNSLTQSANSTATTLSGGVLQIQSNSGIVNNGNTNFAINSAVTLNAASVLLSSQGANLTISGAIGQTGGARGINVTGNQSVILNSATSSTYTGVTRISGGSNGNGVSTFGGILQINFANTAGASASNLVNSASTLEIGGGTLYVVRKSGATNNQTFNGVTFDPGSAYIRNENSATGTLALGAITRSVAGSHANFTAASTGPVTTSTANGTGGILGGWAVRSNDWAVNTAGTITAIASYTTNTWAAGNNTNVTSSNAPAANSTTNSLRFNQDANAYTVTLSGTNILQSGGILSPSVRSNSTNISGGNLTSGNGLDLIVTHYGTGTLTISSNLVNYGATPIGFTTVNTQGVIALSSANTYTGPTTITSGELRMVSGGTLSSSTAVNITNYSSTFPAVWNLNSINQTVASLKGGGEVRLGTATLTVGDATSTTYDGVFTGTGNLTKQGTGTLTLTGVGSTISNYFMTTGGGTLVLKAALGGTGTFQIGGGTELVVGVDNALGAGHVFSLNSATVRSFDANARSFNNTLSMASNQLTTFGSASTGDLTFSGNATLSSSLGVLYWQVDNAQTTFTGNLGQSGGAKQIQKSGAGTLILSGANTYSGGTIISAGTVLANNTSGSAAGSGAVVVNGGVFGGTGSVSGAITVNGGGTLAPGASIQSLAGGALTFNNNSTFAYEIDSAAPLNLAADLQTAAGALTLNGLVNLTITDLTPSTSQLMLLNTTISLINYSGIWNGGLFTYGSTLLADDSTFSAGKYVWLIDYNATSGGVNFPSDQTHANFVNLTLLSLSVPEPSTFCLGLCGVALLVWRFGRKRSARA